MANYKHRVVQGLADLIKKYGGGGRDPMMRAVWYGIKTQVPMLLEALDNSEEAIKLIEDKLREVLDVKEPEPPAPVLLDEVTQPVPVPIEKIKEAVKKAPPKRATAKALRKKKLKPVGEAEVTIEPEESGGPKE